MQEVLAKVDRRGPLAVEISGEAFEALTNRHLDSAYRLAWAILGNDGDADDATQDAFAQAWRKRASLREAAKFDAWFGKILINVCRERLRARAKSRVRELPNALVGNPTEPSVADGAARQADSDAIMGALSRLDPDHRLVVVLRYWADMPLDDIAVRLDVPIGTVKSRLHYALRTMRSRMEDLR